MSQEQAREYKANGWTIEAIADRFNVSDTTVKRWLNPDYAQRQRAFRSQWGATPKGREAQRRYDAARP